MYDPLIQQIEQYANLEEWWKECVFKQLVPAAIIQVAALLVVEGGILFVHNWIAAFLGAVIIGSKIYGTLKNLSLNLMYGFMMLQIRDSFVEGVAVGREATFNGNANVAPELLNKTEESA